MSRTPSYLHALRFCAFLLVALSALPGRLAAANPPPGNPRAAAPNPPQSGARVAGYKLQPMDLVKITFFQEAELDRELRVSQDYKIVLALVGSVDIRDRTVRETEQLITELYLKDYLQNPQVSVTIVEYAQRTVTVLGAVGNPGTVPIPPERTLMLLEVIARAGGFSRLANPKSVSVTRNFPEGPRNIIVNAELMMSGGKDNQWPVQDGDIVSVPERLL